MNSDEIRVLIAGGSLRPPYEIRIRDGKTFTIEDAGNVVITAAFPETLLIADRKLGIAMVPLDAIEAITPLSSGPAPAGGGPG